MSQKQCSTTCHANPQPQDIQTWEVNVDHKEISCGVQDNKKCDDKSCKWTNYMEWMQTDPLWNEECLRMGGDNWGRGQKCLRLNCRDMIK